MQSALYTQGPEVTFPTLISDLLTDLFPNNFSFFLRTNEQLLPKAFL